MSDACELPMYPAAGGPVTVAFSHQTGEVVACGEYDNIINKEFYSFDGITWEPLPLLQEDHVPAPYFTNSYFMEGIGLWVGGDDGSGYDSDLLGRMVNELLNSEGQWVTLPLESAYEDNLYQAPCVVPMNSTHIFFSGGIILSNYTVLADTWILDLENLEWTPSTPMLTPRWFHGCLLTDDGEVLVAGGYEDFYFDVPSSSVDIFNPVSLEWRESGNLSNIYPDTPGLLLWKEEVILFEYESDRIWEREDDLGWRLMDVSMGATFYGDEENAVLVPDSWKNACA